MVRVLVGVMVLAIAAGAQAAPARVALPAVGEEILELRDAHSKHYHEGGGRVRAVISSAPVHTRNRRGEWVGTDGRDSLDFAADAWVYSNAPTGNYGANLANRVGRWLVTGVLHRYRSFIKLDLSSIPTGTSLDACTLNLRLYTWNYADTFVNIHRVTEDWQEMVVTWNNQPAVTADSTACLEVSALGWYRWPVTGMVQDWVDETYPNYGFRLSLVDEATMANSQVYFYSKDNPLYPERIPYLVVWYQLPGEIIIVGGGRTPAHPFSGEPIAVSARIWAVGEGIDTTELQYSNDRVDWTSVGPDSINPADSTYYFSIPAQTGGDSLHHRIYAASGLDGDLTSPVQSVYIPFTYAIAEIQECDTLVGEVTPKLGEYVHTRGVVTGFLEPRKFYIADGPGAWNGVYIYNAYQTVEDGDSIDIIGTVAEYNGLTQVQNPARFEVNGGGVAFETTKVSFAEARQEAFENALVRLDSVRIVGASGAFGSNVAYQCASFDYADTMTLYSTALSAFPGTPIPEGAFNLVCNIGDYNGRQLIPRYPGDVTQLADLSAVAILAPGAAMDAGDTVTPVAVFRNNDASVAARNFRVSFRIGGFYQVDRVIEELLPGEEDTVAFNTWTAVAGSHPVLALVAFSADPDRSNDTLAATLDVTSPAPEPGVWTEVAPMPLAPSGKPARRGAWLTVSNGMIYATKGYKTQDFYRYDPAGDSWTELAPAPVDPVKGRSLEKGCRGAADGDNLIYMVHGNNTTAFWQYDIAANEWTGLAEVPLGPSGKRVKGGGDLLYLDVPQAGAYVYLLKGDRTEFYRYDIAAGQWQQLADLPTGIRNRVKRDGWLVADGHGQGRRFIYAHKPSYFDRATEAHELWQYDVAGDSWLTNPETRLAGMPLAGLHGGKIKRKKAKDGGSAVRDGRVIYALKGGNTQQFWMYDIEANTWLELDTVPTLGSTGRRRRMSAGADLVRRGGGLFYALKGNKTAEMWRYAVPTAAGRQPERGGVMAGGLPAGAPFVKLGPNPVTGGRATLRYSLPKAGPASVRVYDVSGRNVLSRGLAASQTGSISLDLRGLSAGIYLLKLEAGGYEATRKLVVQQ